MLIKEYRILMPLTVEEYHIGQLYATSITALEETGGGEGVQIVQNEPFEGLSFMDGRFTSGQYTRKYYHFASKVNWVIRKIAPKKSLTAVEESWNAFPYCKTVGISTNDDYTITVESIHLPDRGTTENALEIAPELLQKREVEYIDIAAKAHSIKDYTKQTDPRLFKSKKIGRGPLKRKEWWKTADPVMCCYKLVTIDVRTKFFHGAIENFLSKEYPRSFQRVNRSIFCWLDRWYGMTMEDIRRLEAETKEKLDLQRKTKSLRGTKPDD